MIKGAIFDMDGLMLDTERLSTDGWLYAGKQLNYPITEQIIDEIRGTNKATSRKIFKDRFGDSVDYEAANQIEREYVDRQVEENGVPVKPGLFQLLDYLKENGVKLAVATSTARTRAERYLKNAGIYEYFDKFAFGDEVENGKPAPDIFLHAAALISVQPEECVVFEDSPVGIRAAYSAKTKVIGVQDLALFDDSILEMLSYNCRVLSDAIPLLASL